MVVASVLIAFGTGAGGFGNHMDGIWISIWSGRNGAGNGQMFLQ